MSKTYRCLTCGFGLTCDEQDDLATVNRSNHENELSGVKDSTACPACHSYIKRHGGRKNGKVDMPDISPGEVGTLIEETPAVKTQWQEVEVDYQNLVNGGDNQALRSKYAGKKLFGFSIDDCVAIHTRNQMSKNLTK